MSKEWMDDAACGLVDPELFFPLGKSGRRYGDEPGSSWSADEAPETALAKKVCAECPVAAECLVYGMTVDREQGYRWGIWGGMTAEERAQLDAEVRVP